MSETLTAPENVVQDGEILAYRLPALREQIETMNRKASKLGKSPLVLTVGERLVREYFQENAFGYKVKYIREYVRVSVSGDRPVLSGWTLAATKNVMPNGEMLLKEVPGTPIPDRFKSPAWNCEHCNMNRQRKELVIVRNVETGEYKQVGKTCLRDFLGGMDVAAYLAYYALVMSVDMGDADPDEPGYGSGGRNIIAYDPISFLVVTALIVRRIGWMSVGKARELSQSGQGACPTLTLVGMYLRNRNPEEQEFRREVGDPEEQDNALALAALTWARAQSPAESGYLYNLGVAARQDCVLSDTMGLMASAIAAYQKAMDKAAEAKAKAETAPKAHVGTLGKREVFSVTVKAVRCFDGDYGVRSLVRMEDASGNVLTWWTGEAPDWTEEGATVKVKGTVKAHEDYKGTPQTVLSRVALVA